MELFTEVALGSTSSRGRAVRVGELPALQKYAQNNSLELYRSYFFFDRSLKEHLDAYKTVRGYPGSPIIDTLTLDIDKVDEGDQQTLLRAYAVFESLTKEYGVALNDIRIFFSGTGYHFALPNLWHFKTQQEVKDTLSSQFPECDSIYDKTRLLRVANTINAKSGLYKIPLTHEEFLELNAESVLELAKSPRNDLRFPPFANAHTPALINGVVQPKFVMQNQPSMVHDEGLTPVITCMQKLFNAEPEKGSRHISMLRMISAFRREGVPRTAIEILMQTWAGEEMPPGEIRKAVFDTFDKDYKFSCDDHIMSKWCDERCIFYKKKSYNATLPRSMEQIESDIVKAGNTIVIPAVSFQPMLQLEEAFDAYPDEFVVVIGDTGIGKSAFIQHLVTAERKKTLYLNFEMPERLAARRFLQIANAMTKQDIIQYYMNPDAESLTESIAHIHMISHRINVHVLEQIIATGEYKVVVVDTLECFVTPGITEITPKTEFLAHEMKRIAMKYKTCIIAIHHVTKASIQDMEGKRRALTVHGSKGSSAIEQEADKVIMVEGDRENLHRRVKSGKARDEIPFDVKMVFDAERTFRFYGEKLWDSSDSSSKRSRTTSSLPSPSEEKGQPSSSSGALRSLRS